MIKKYLVKWKTYNFINGQEEAKERVFDDIMLKDFYIRVNDDQLDETFIIPYNTIYEIQILRVEGEA